MNDQHTTQIKTRRDGSIDTAHYMEIGRQRRAEQARALTGMALPKRQRASVAGRFLNVIGI